MTAQLTSLKVVCQLFTPHLILPESGCSEATAYAKERKSVVNQPIFLQNELLGILGVELFIDQTPNQQYQSHRDDN